MRTRRTFAFLCRCDPAGDGGRLRGQRALLEPRGSGCRPGPGTGRAHCPPRIAARRRSRGATPPFRPRSIGSGAKSRSCGDRRRWKRLARSRRRRVSEAVETAPVPGSGARQEIEQSDLELAAEPTCGRRGAGQPRPCPWRHFGGRRSRRCVERRTLRAQPGAARAGPLRRSRSRVHPVSRRESGLRPGGQRPVLARRVGAATRRTPPSRSPGSGPSSRTTPRATRFRTPCSRSDSASPSSASRSRRRRSTASSWSAFPRPPQPTPRGNGSASARAVPARS